MQRQNVFFIIYMHYKNHSIAAHQASFQVTMPQLWLEREHSCSKTCLPSCSVIFWNKGFCIMRDVPSLGLAMDDMEIVLKQMILL